jgi:predicted amidophosphoribosyltransferase
MAEVRCPQCGRDLALDDTTCSGCGRSLTGAALADAGGSARQPSPPPEPPSGKLSPELMKRARQQFSEEEFLAGLHEIQKTGGMELQDFIRELEQEAEHRD